MNVFNSELLEEELYSIDESDYSDEEKNIFSYFAEIRLMFTSRRTMLAFTSPEWLACIIGEKHPLYPCFKEVKTRELTNYLYQREGKDHIYVTDLKTHEEFKIIKESLEESTMGKLKAGNSIMTMMLTCFDKEWWQNGMM